MKAFLRTWCSRAVLLFQRRRFEREMAEEMRAHLEVLIAEGVDAGLSPAEARLAAEKRFGGVTQITEECRAGRGFVWLEQTVKDFGFAARALSRARGFTSTILAMLVLGIGTATLAFSLTSWILIFSPPYPHPEQLFLIGTKDKQNPANPWRPGIYLQAYQEQTDVFSEFAAVSRELVNVVVDTEPQVASLNSASVDCFRTLGINPVLGRGFLPEEHRPGADNVVVITDLFWRRHFQASPDVLGKKLLVDQQPCTVVGVLASGQSFPPTFEGDLYRPLVLAIDPANPLSLGLFVIGRLKPEVSPEAARAALAAVTLPPLPAWAGAFLADQQPVLLRPTDVARPESYWVIAIAAALLYAIACLNAMNLMLVRLIGRRRELSIRLALGGSRWQILRLLTIESVGLALLACLLLLAATYWVFPSLLALILGNEAMRHFSQWNPRTLGCIGVLTLLAFAAVVLVPVWHLLKADASPGLKNGGAEAGVSRSTGQTRTALVVFQAAFAVVLLAGTGLMMRSFERLQRADLGFDPLGRVKVSIAFPRGYDLAPEARFQLFERLEERLAALPGVRAVSFGQDSLLIGNFAGTAQLLMPDGTYQPVAGNFVGADFMETAGLVLKKGRWLSGRRGEFEVVINEAFARARFGDDDPVGKSFKLLVSGDAPITVVGVVGDVRDAVRSGAGMRFYCPSWSYPQNISSLVLRLDRDPGPEFTGLVRQAIYHFDPKLIATQVSTISEVVNNGMWAERFAYRILKGLSSIALVLAVVGLFSVIAYTVDVRMREFGVRMALGAKPADLLRLVFERGLATAAIGVVAGVAGALALTRFMRSLLFETTPHDPLVYAGVAGVLLAAAGLACWLPARRAARVDITRLLRTE